jgi:hypothetical protein
MSSSSPECYRSMNNESGRRARAAVWDQRSLLWGPRTLSLEFTPESTRFLGTGRSCSSHALSSQQKARPADCALRPAPVMSSQGGRFIPLNGSGHFSDVMSPSRSCEVAPWRARRLMPMEVPDRGTGPRGPEWTSRIAFCRCSFVCQRRAPVAERRIRTQGRVSRQRRKRLTACLVASHRGRPHAVSRKASR